MVSVAFRYTLLTAWGTKI